MTAKQAVLVSLLALVPGCKDKGSDSSKDGVSTKANSAPTATYKVRGLVKFLPTADSPEMEVHHEEIPDFVTRKGKKKGMMSMTMAFGIAKDLSLDGIAVSDKIAFDLEVDWERKPVLMIKSIKKLPADTELKF